LDLESKESGDALQGGTRERTKPLKIAVIGAGYWGKKVINEIIQLSKFDGVTIGPVVDNSPTTLEQCRREFGDLDYRLDYKGLLSDPELSAVHIATPNQTHFEVASAFIKNGKNVLVEKPLALKSAEAYQLAGQARDKGIVLSAGHIHRFNNGVRDLKTAMRGHVLGDLYYIGLRWTGFLPPQLQRDVITDLAPHPFDISNYLLGDWPEKVTCRAKGYRTPASEEVAFIDAEYSNRLTVHIELSWLDRAKRRDVRAVGSEGIAHLDCTSQKAFVERGERTEEVTISPSNTLREEILHFAECVKKNQRSESFSNLSDGLLGARVVTLLEASRESLQKEATVPVRFPLDQEVLVR
jgi:UDP-N-acetylglucosamine 3-dehydrogenase